MTSENRLPVRRCIYCDQGMPPFTDEHIIPFGLGGKDILPEASCAECQTITAKFEGKCLRLMLGPIRTRLRLPTRRPKERPTELPFKVTFSDSSSQTFSFPIHEHPTTFTLFQFEPARILYGLPEFQPDTYKATIWIGGLTKKELGYVGKKFGVTSFQAGAFEPRAFTQMLAKIAHSYAIAKHGFGSFEPLLNRVILGQPSGFNHFIGSAPEVEPAEPFLHTIGLERRQIRSETYLIAHIRLFACLGAPRYHAVVGRILQ